MVNLADQRAPERHFHLPFLPDGWRSAVFFGFAGGIAPSLLRLAAEWTTVTAASVAFDWPTAPFILGVLIYGGVGVISATAFKQFSAREALIAGILAPSLFTNLVSGAREGNKKLEVKTTGVIEWRIPSLSGTIVTAAIAAEQPQADQNKDIFDGEIKPGVFVVEGTSNLKGYKKIDFEWLLSRNDVSVDRVRIDLLANKSDFDRVKTIFVSPKYLGVLKIPPRYRYLRVDQGAPIEIPDYDSQLLIKAEVRPSKSNDFYWALGGPRQYKVMETKPVFLRPNNSLGESD